MRTLKTLKPGEPPSGDEILTLASRSRRRELPRGSRVRPAAREKGTKDLLARYGASLLYVRYRYDEDTGERLKTVGLVVQRRSRRREVECPGSRRLGVQAGVAARRRVALRIGLRERDLQGRVKSVGGWWDPIRRVWVLRRDVAERLNLLHRVVGGGS